MYLLKNQVMDYAWGDTAAIATLQGRPPSTEPEAELWMGAHPKAPSSALVCGEWAPLNHLIEVGPPEELLGKRVAERFGRLPFLFKVLAAAEPLSLQAHPNLEQAKLGFAREEAAGVPRSAPHRNYRDDNHKPELICALSPFEALCGFRPREELVELLAELDCGALTPCFAQLSTKSESEGLKACFSALMQADKGKQSELTNAAQGALTKKSEHDRFGAAFTWALRLNAAYPGDIGVITSLMLNYTRLEPGEALYLPAGNLHAYLKGTGLELMANSDNVLRGGLTPKHVDVPELLSVLNFEGELVNKRAPEERGPGQYRYPTPAPEFELWKHVLTEDTHHLAASDGPEILLCVEGKASYETPESLLELLAGESAWVPAATKGYALRGPGVVYRAVVPT